MSGVAGALSDKPTQLPARFDAGFAWTLDRRSVAAREIASDLWELWQALGGVDSLSPQKRWLCERVVFLRRRMLAYESAVCADRDPPIDAGVYSNHANVAMGYLKSLGLERLALSRESLAVYLAKAVPAAHESAA